MPTRKNKQKSTPPKVKWYHALAAESVFNPSIIQQKSTKPVKNGWYSKQQQNFGNRYTEYQNQDGEIVIVTEIIDIGITSNWPDAVCIGPVTKHIRTIYNDSD